MRPYQLIRARARMHTHTHTRMHTHACAWILTISFMCVMKLYALMFSLGERVGRRPPNQSRLLVRNLSASWLSSVLKWEKDRARKGEKKGKKNFLEGASEREKVKDKFGRERERERERAKDIYREIVCVCVCVLFGPCLPHCPRPIHTFF